MPLADVPPLRGEAVQALLAEIPGWEAPADHHLFRSYKFADFQTGLDFVNRVGAAAELQGHHPDVLLAWGKVEVTVFTHTIDGLTESDFALAGKIEGLYRG